jgi:UDP-N-acetylmuramoyl-L-alanyl-D-glutamate--2,6-diaminopimelate ligase
MLFRQAIAEAAIVQSAGPNPDVVRVTHDSRNAAPGTIFLAMQGETTDGNRYIAQAIAAGTNAIVTDSESVLSTLVVTNPAIAAALCQHGRHALANIAATLTGHPERRLSMTGVTGTNGKTTTTFLLEAMLAAAGRKSLLLGTIEVHLAGKKLPASHTTPEADALYALLQDAVTSSVSEAVMEVSSHALQQGRTWGIGYEVAVFTNLTRDHLDYHGTMEAYFAAKQRLFVAGGTGAAAPHFAVLNLDDEHGRLLAQRWRLSCGRCPALRNWNAVYAARATWQRCRQHVTRGPSEYFKHSRRRRSGHGSRPYAAANRRRRGAAQRRARSLPAGAVRPAVRRGGGLCPY